MMGNLHQVMKYYCRDSTNNKESFYAGTHTHTHTPAHAVSFLNMVTLLGIPIRHHLPVVILAPLCRGTEPYCGVFLYSPKFAFPGRCFAVRGKCTNPSYSRIAECCKCEKILPEVPYSATAVGRSLCTTLLSAGTAGPAPGSFSPWP